MKIEKLADKVEQWVQWEANKQQSKWEVESTKHSFLAEFATKLDNESKSNGNRNLSTYLQTSCTTTMMTGPWEKSGESEEKVSLLDQDIIVTKMLRIICEFCIARIHHLVKWTSIRLFYCYICLGRPTFKTYLQEKSKKLFQTLNFLSNAFLTL